MKYIEQDIESNLNTDLNDNQTMKKQTIATFSNIPHKKEDNVIEKIELSKSDKYIKLDFKNIKLKLKTNNFFTPVDKKEPKRNKKTYRSHINYSNKQYKLSKTEQDQQTQNYRIKNKPNTSSNQETSKR